MDDKMKCDTQTSCLPYNGLYHAFNIVYNCAIGTALGNLPAGGKV